MIFLPLALALVVLFLPGDEAARAEVIAIAPQLARIFDPQARWKVVPSALRSQGRHTPFLGYELPGQVRHTLVAGRVAFSR